ncbi:MAG: hypothetical protein WDN49_17015 [Acetobacteraceae bacterium]
MPVLRKYCHRVINSAGGSRLATRSRPTNAATSSRDWAKIISSPRVSTGTLRTPRARSSSSASSCSRIFTDVKSTPSSVSISLTLTQLEQPGCQ